MRFLWGRQIPGRRIEALSQSVRRVWGNMQNSSTSLTANARLITNRRILHQMRRFFCRYWGDKERNAKGESSGSHCRGRREHSGHPYLSWGGASVEQKITQPGTTKAPSRMVTHNPRSNGPKFLPLISDDVGVLWMRTLSMRSFTDVSGPQSWLGESARQMRTSLSLSFEISIEVLRYTVEGPLFPLAYSECSFHVEFY
jgi:hypothetical protein